MKNKIIRLKDIEEEYGTVFEGEPKDKTLIQYLYEHGLPFLAQSFEELDKALGRI